MNCRTHTFLIQSSVESREDNSHQTYIHQNVCFFVFFFEKVRVERWLISIYLSIFLLLFYLSKEFNFHLLHISFPCSTFHLKNSGYFGLTEIERKKKKRERKKCAYFLFSILLPIQSSASLFISIFKTNTTWIEFNKQINK